MTHKIALLYSLLLALLLAGGLPGYSQDRILQVSGKVTDELDRALPGTSVKIAGTKIVTITRSDGNYRIHAAVGRPLLLFVAAPE